jgi:hydrogenase maturation protease
MRTLILCLGNEHVLDDGLGAQIGRILASLSLAEEISIVTMPRLRLGLLDELVGVDHLVVVDALAVGTEPGACTVVDVTQQSAAVVASGCRHASDVRDLINLARDVAPAGPDLTITIAGVEGAHFDHYGEFSRAVYAAVPRLVDLLLLSIGAGLKSRLRAAESFRKSRLEGPGPCERSASVWPVIGAGNDRVRQDYRLQ